MDIRSEFAKIEAINRLQRARIARMEADRDDKPMAYRLDQWKFFWQFITDAAASRREAMTYAKN